MNWKMSAQDVYVMQCQISQCHSCKAEDGGLDFVYEELALTRVWNTEVD